VVPPLITRLDRLSERARHATGRLRGVYALTEDGAEEVAEARGVEMSTLWYEDGRRRSSRNLVHSAEIGVFYGALRTALEHAGLALEGWLNDERLAARDPQHGGPNYDRVLVPGIKEPLAVLPDAAFTLSGHRYFVEIDRARTNLASWMEKIRAFEAYRGSPKLQARCRTDDFTVLIVCPSETRRRRIAEELLKVTKHETDRYRFLLTGRVHSVTIRYHWQVVTKFDWTPQRVVQVPDKLQWQAAPLWELAQ
jgi:hypothetical protein